MRRRSSIWAWRSRTRGATAPPSTPTPAPSRPMGATPTLITTPPASTIWRATTARRCATCVSAAISPERHAERGAQAELLGQLGVEGDLGGGDQLGDRAARLGRLGGALELGLVRVGELHRDLEVRGRDREAGLDLVERDGSLRVDVLRREAHLLQLRRQRHREAAGVRGGDQLFGAGAGAGLEPLREVIRDIRKCPAGGRKRPLAGLEAPLPIRGR